MKKVSLILLLLIVTSSFAFVLAENMPVSPIGSDEVEKIQNITGSIPIDEQGKIDAMKLEGVLGLGKSKAEERIDKINAWLLDNTAWLKFVFRMQPAISWIFILNIYFILLFIVSLGFNGENVWFFIENELLARVFGFAFFLILLMTNFYKYLAYGVFHIIVLFLTVVLPAALMWSLVALVVIVIILVVIARFFPEALSFIARWIGKMVGKHMAKSGVEKVVAEAKTQEDRLKQSADEAEALTKGLQGK